MEPCNGRGARRDERAAEILAPLMRGEAGLAFRGAVTPEDIESQVHAQIRAAVAEGTDRMTSDELRLVEAALAALAGKERNGHDDQLSGQIRDGEYRIGEERAQALRQGVHAVVFQQVEQGAQFIAVEAPSDSLLEGRCRRAAGAAERFFSGEIRFVRQRLAASVAERARLWGKMIPAGRTDGKKREAAERDAADAAIGGEEHSGKAVECGLRRTSEHANHRAPGRIGRWRDFRRQRKTLTTEDAPRSGGRNAES